MLKYLCVTSALAIALAAPAHAEFLYQGFMKITSKNLACTLGPAVGTLMRVQYHPRTVSGGTQNANMSAFTITNFFSGQSYRLDVQSFSTTAKTVVNTSMASTTLKTLAPAKIAVTSQVPATLTNLTQTATIVGSITNPKGLPSQASCVVGFLWTGHVRP